MTGATLLSIAYCKESKTLCEVVLQVLPLSTPTYTNTRDAFLATAPDHSTSRFASSMSPEQLVDVPLPGTSNSCGSFLANPDAERNASVSLVLIAVCPTTASFCPVPSKPAS